MAWPQASASSRACRLLLTVAGNSPAEAQLLATLLGALAAFLVFNAHPASIFMGDTGSLFTGLVLAAVSVVAGNSAGPRELLSVVAAPVMVLFIPIFDTAFVVIARILSGRAPVRGRA